MNNLYSNGGFFWWVGVVEDRNDPLFLGRCRVRIAGYHNPSAKVLPTQDLPWAMPIQPITSAAISGIGSAPVGPVEGTWVVGFFRDGEDCQEPLFMGTLGGIPQDPPIDDGNGFQDPYLKYPVQDLLNESDTNRLARANKTGTIVDSKIGSRITGVPTANGEASWDQPEIPYAARYPFNHVTASESGHLVELDDTPGAERVHIYHKTGSFVEVDADGSMVRRIVGDDYQILERHGHVYIQGNANVTIDGNCNVLVKNTCNLEVNGSLKAHVHNDLELNAAGKLSLSGGSVEIKSSGDTNILGDNVNVYAEKNLYTYAVEKNVVNTAGPVVINGGGLQLMPGIAPIADKSSAPDPVGTVSPVLPTFPPLTGVLRDTDRSSFEDEKTHAEEIGSGDAQDFARQREKDLSTGSQTSTPNSTSPEEVPIVSDYPIALKIVAAAKADLGIIETGTRKAGGYNYGGTPGSYEELPEGQAGRIDEILTHVGLDNQARVKAKGIGYYWSVPAVVEWWRQGGVQVPNLLRAQDLAAWGRKQNLYGSEPAVGAIVLYGPAGQETNAGVVASVDGQITTIEGDTNGSGYTTACGVFLKKANPDRVSGYILPPGVKPVTTTAPSVSSDMQAAIDKLHGLIPETVIAELPEVIDKFEINTPLRLAHFLAQCQHESANFRARVELISEAKANHNYGNRMGNGPESSGDGYRYRGRGYIQITGKETYQAFSKFVPENLVQYPDLVASKYPLLSAAWFWTKYKVTHLGNLNYYADRGSDVASVTKVSQLVNGGNNGLTERIADFQTIWTRLA